jgi:hypothetical protein
MKYLKVINHDEDQGTRISWSKEDHEYLLDQTSHIVWLINDLLISMNKMDVTPAQHMY